MVNGTMQITARPPPTDIVLPLQHTLAYAQAMDQKIQWSSVENAGDTVAYALMMRGPLGVPTLLRGPVWVGAPSKADRTTALRRLAPRLIEAEAPDTALAKAGFRQIVTATHVAEWDLTAPAATRLAAAHGKWRNALQQSLRAPFKLTHRPFAGPATHPIFDHQRSLARSRRFKVLPAQATCAIAAALPQGARLWEATVKGQPIAMMLFLRHGPVVTYQIGWSGPEGRQHNAHHRMLWEAADWYARRGARRLDLGSVDTESAPGLARFKIGSGAQVRALGGSYIRLY